MKKKDKSPELLLAAGNGVEVYRRDGPGRSIWIRRTTCDGHPTEAQTTSQKVGEQWAEELRMLSSRPSFRDSVIEKGA